MLITRFIRFLLLLSLAYSQSLLAQPPDQDFESVVPGPVTAIGATSSYTLNGVRYSVTYRSSDQQIVHGNDIGVFLAPNFLSLSANFGVAQEVRIADAAGNEFKFNSMQISFGNCGATGSCTGVYELAAYRDGAQVALELRDYRNQLIDFNVKNFSITSKDLWANIDEIRVTKLGSTVIDRDFYMAIDDLDFGAEVGGVVTGLVSGESVVLQNNGGETVTVGPDGSFNFPTSLRPGDSYNVTVLTQPGPITETCTVANGSGTIPTATHADITNVAVTCTINLFGVSGAVSGLATGQSISLRNLGADEQTLTADGNFAFSPQSDGSLYDVTVSSQPVGQTCSVINGSGILSGSPVSNVAVTCVDDQYSIGGQLSGLVSGDSVVLQNNAGDNLTLFADGAFNFPTSLGFGDSYDVTVLIQPPSPSETCIVSNGTGTTPASNVNNISVICTIDSFSVGGTVSGAAPAATLVLQNNGTADQPVTGNSNFSFLPQADGSTYSISVSVQPPGQTCSVSGGSGILSGSDISSVSVTCVDNQYNIGGLLSGLVPGDSVVLQNNGGDNLTLTADGAFNFTNTVGFGDPYDVTVLTQPPSPSETCNVSNGTGTTPASNVNNITVVCAIDSFSVFATVIGAASGASLVLQNNGADDQIAGNGTLNFSPQADGSTYSISVSAQPPGQTCTVTNGSGTVAGAAVGNVTVNCVDDPPTPPAQPVAIPVMPAWLVGLMLTMIAGVGASRIRGRF